MNARSTDDLVQEELERAVHMHKWEMEQILVECGSPIEKLFAVQFFGTGTGEGMALPIGADPPETYGMAWRMTFPDDPGWVLIPQYPVRVDDHDYRLDFAMICGVAKVAVECDGHDFHERTKQQAARDKSRDRALIKVGWTVLHFTGAELYGNARKCAIEASSVMWAKSGRRDEE